MFDQRDQPWLARLRRLRRGRNWILGGGVLCGLAALLFSLASPRIYRATTYVLVSDSKLDASVLPSPLEYSLLPTYISFIDNDGLVAQALHHFQLDQPPYRLTPRLLRSRYGFDVEIPRSTRLLQIEVDFPSAAMAAQLANYLALTASSFNQHLTEADADATQRFLSDRMGRAAAALQQAATARLRVNLAAKMDEREKEVAGLLVRQQELAATLGNLNLALAQATGESQALAGAVQQQPPLVHLQKSLDQDRFLEQALQRLQLDSDSRIGVTEDVLNPVRDQLLARRDQAGAEAAADRQGIAAANAELTAVNATLRARMPDLVRQRDEVAKQQQAYDVASATYTASARDYRNASVSVNARSQQFQQIAPALPPEKPVRPRTLLNTVLAVLLGWLMLAGLALARESYREIRAADPVYSLAAIPATPEDGRVP
ncbi:MAG: Wzz/FepE/Etk N-terminal domain-containing protein [Terriglobales bacterium]